MIRDVAAGGPRPEAAKPSEAFERGDQGEPFRLPDDAAQERPKPRRPEREQAEEARAAAQLATLEAALRAGRRPAAEEAEIAQSDDEQESAALEGWASAPVEQVGASEPIDDGELIASRPKEMAEGRHGRREIAEPKDTARHDAPRPDDGKLAKGTKVTKGGLDASAKLDEAMLKRGAERVEVLRADGEQAADKSGRVEHHLKVSRGKPGEAAASRVVGALGEAVRRALKALAEAGRAGAKTEPIGDDADPAALAAAFARAEGTGQSALVAARAAVAMPTGAGVAEGMDLQTFDLSSDLGMVVKVRSEDGGELEVRVRMEGNSLLVRIRAEDEGMRARMLEALPELRRELAQSPEIVASGAEVDVQEQGASAYGQGNESQQSGRASGDEAEDWSDGGQSDGRKARPVEAKTAGTGDPVVRRAEDGRLYVVA